MAERKSWAVSQAGGEVTTLDARHALASLMWPGSSATVKRSGRLPKAGMDALAVTATSPTPDGYVHVAPGHLWSMGTRSIAPYAQTLDAIKDVHILSTPAHGSLTRWDLVIAQQNDTGHADADNTWTVKQVVGTPSSTPVDPTVTGSPDYVVLARVVVGPGVTTITNANITQLLTAHTVAVGGLLPQLNQSERDALAGTAYDGMHIYRRDRDWAETYDGTAWRVQGIAACTTTADRDSAVTHPTTGTHAYCSSTGLHYTHDGTVWVPDRVYAGRILAAAGVVHDEVAGTEVNITKLAIENYRVKSGWFYVFHARLYLSGPDFGDDFFIRVRKDTALTGTVVADTPLFPASTNLDFAWYFALPWKATADDTDADFYLSIQRVAGTGTADVMGDKKSAFWIQPQGGDSALWSEVT